MDYGYCSVCGGIFKLVNSTGVLRKHGHVHGHPQCTGSGTPPSRPAPPPSGLQQNSQVSFLDASSISLELPSNPLPGSSHSTFIIARPQRATIKRIPRGARVSAARLFEKRLAKVVANPQDEGAWRALLEFGSCLASL